MRDSNSTPQRGNALVLAVLLVVVMIALAMAMMTTSLQDRKQSRSATEHTQGLYVAEAGINHAIADLVAGGSGILGSEPTPLAFGGGAYWVMAVQNPDASVTVVASSDLAGERQAIEVVLRREINSLFTLGLFGDMDLGATGNVFTDSYESDLGTYASQAVNVDGATGRIYAKAGGSLGSNADITLRGGVVVMGDATPGPGHTVNFGGPGVHVAGSTAPAPTATPLPPVTYSPTVASLGDLDGSATLGAGTYRYDLMDLDDSDTLTIQGDVHLYIDGDVEVAGQAQVVIEPGARLTVHHGGALFDLRGKGVLNGDKLPKAFVLYSMATTVRLAGTSGLYGAAYAPAGTVEPVGTSDIFGSFIGREVFVGGTANFHFDERLADDPDLTRDGVYSILSWRKVPYGTVPVAATGP